MHKQYRCKSEKRKSKFDDLYIDSILLNIFCFNEYTYIG